MNENPSIIREKVNGSAKYCRLPIQRKNPLNNLGDAESDTVELSAETILSMPHEQAAQTIDAIVRDWAYWLNRANELYVLYKGAEAITVKENT